MRGGESRSRALRGGVWQEPRSRASRGIPSTASEAEAFRYSLSPLSYDKGSIGQYRLSFFGRRVGPCRSRRRSLRLLPHPALGGKSVAEYLAVRGVNQDRE